jgi:hypothetical protein
MRGSALHDLLGKLGSSISDKLPMLFYFPVNHVRLDLMPGPSFASKLAYLLIIFLFSINGNKTADSSQIASPVR